MSRDDARLEELHEKLTDKQKKENCVLVREY